MRLLPKRRLIEIERIGPSWYHILSMCELRGILVANRAPRQLPGSPGRHTGTVIHEMLRRARSGEIRDEEAMKSFWNGEIAASEIKLSADPLEKTFVPLEKSVKNFNVKKALTFSRAKEFFRDTPSGLPPARLEAGIDTDYEVENTDEKIYGIIDLVLRTDEGVELLDLKTGDINEAKSDEDNPKEEYMKQLKLYAALYHVQERVWPKKLTLFGLDASRHSFECKPAECEKLLNDAEKKLREINEQIADKTTFRQEDMANPSSENCKYCTYRPSCGRYWAEKIEGDDWPLDFCGKNIEKEKKQTGDGLYRVVVQTSPEKTVTIRGIPSNGPLNMDEKHSDVMFCNLVKDILEGHYKWGKYSYAYNTSGYPEFA